MLTYVCDLKEAFALLIHDADHRILNGKSSNHGQSNEESNPPESRLHTGLS